MAGSTYLNADNVRESQGACISASKVLGNGHLPSVAKRKREVVGTGGAHFLDDPCLSSVSNSSFRIYGEDSDSSKEPLEFHSLAIEQASAWGQLAGIKCAEEFLAKIKKVSRFIHNASGDVDVD